MTEAETPETLAPEATTPQQQPEQPETFDREYVEKLRKENASYRTKAKEAQEAAEAAKTAAEREKMGEVDRIKAEKADLLAQLEAERTKATTAQRQAALTGKVADPAAALKLLDDSHLTEDGSIDVDKLLEAYPFMAVTQAPGAHSVGGAPTPSKGALRPEDFRGKSPEWIDANIHRLQKN